jgi:Phage integrase family
VAKPTTWLFPGRDPLLPITTRQLYRVVRETAEALQITKRVSPNVLRHSFATHLLEQGSHPQRRPRLHCFPRSRLKKLRFRCNWEAGTPDPTFGAMIGTACTLPASRFGTDTCNWC